MRSDARPPRWRPAAIFSVVLLALVASPIRENHREDPADGFPLSYYPMFTKARDGVTTLTHAIGIRADGTELPLNWRLAGSGGMNQVRRVMRRREKAGEAEELCREIVERILALDSPKHRDLVAVALVRDRFDLDRFMSGDRAPSSRRERARVTIRRERAR